MRKGRLLSLLPAGVVALCLLGSAGIASAQYEPGDWNGDWRVNDDDLSLLLSQWGAYDPSPPPPWWWPPLNPLPVDDGDLSDLLANWRTGPPPCGSPGDADQDGDCDDDDLSILLAHWGQDVTGDFDGGCSKGEFSGRAPVDDDDLSMMCRQSWQPPLVPEPTTMSLLAIGTLALLRHKRRR